MQEVDDKFKSAARDADHAPLRFKRLHAAAILPSRPTAGSAGYDLRAIDGGELVSPIPLNESAVVSIDSWQIATGVAVEIPPGWYGRIAPRSGLAARGLIVMGGVIDSDYRGEIVVMLAHIGFADIKIEPGDRIAQLIVERCATFAPEWTDELHDTTRGASGFGGTGE